MDAPAQAAVKPITAKDIARLEEDDLLWEVVDGRWVEEDKMTDRRHSEIEIKLTLLVGPHVYGKGLGKIYSGDFTFVLKGTKEKIEVMRRPDLSFVAAARLDDNVDDYHYLAPDLAVEIVSKSERRGKIEAKVKDYLQYGTRQVWVIYPKKGQIVVHLADGTTHSYGLEDRLPGGDVLPGFEAKVADILGTEA